MNEKSNISDFTETEFFQLILSITDPEDGLSEKELDLRIFKFEELCEHPSGSDLIFWPDADGLDTPEEIIRIIKQWRAAEGRAGFKPE